MSHLGRARRTAPLAAAALAALVAGASGDCSGAEDWTAGLIDKAYYGVEAYDVDTAYIWVSSDDGSTLAVTTEDSYGTVYKQASSLGSFTSCYKMSAPVKLLASPGRLIVKILCNNWLDSCPVHYRVELTKSTSALEAPSPSPSSSPSLPRPSSLSVSTPPFASPSPLSPSASPSFGTRTSTCQTQTACAKACGGSAFTFSETDSAGSAVHTCKAFPSGRDCCPTVAALALAPVSTTSLAHRSAVWKARGIAAVLSFVTAAYTLVA